MLYQLVLITSVGVTPWQGVHFQNLEQCEKEKNRISQSINAECMPIMSQDELQKNMQSSIMMLMNLVNNMPK